MQEDRQQEEDPKGEGAAIQSDRIDEVVDYVP